MSKILVLPDVHMKTELLDRVATLLDRHHNWICLSIGDLWDDWARPLQDYEEFATAWRRFLGKYEDRLYQCWGNHDYGYWTYPGHHSGYNADAKDIVRQSLIETALTLEPRLQLVHVFDKVIFSHAGITRNLLEEYKAGVQERVETSFVRWINEDLSPERLWHEDSPLWHRPTNLPRINSFSSGHYFQVVGHTPIRSITHNVDDEILYVDTWSTDSARTPLGDKSLVVVDTEDFTWEVIPYEE